jgi:hypothetical protein
VQRTPSRLNMSEHVTHAQAFVVAVDLRRHLTSGPHD